MTGIKFDANELLSYLDNANARANTAVELYANEGAKVMENYAKRNRPWTDRTGHARQRLHGWIERTPKGVKINIGHGVDYGYYLEMCHQRRFEILNPTVNACSAKIISGYKGLLNEILKK